jgi:hypothetical protein
LLLLLLLLLLLFVPVRIVGMGIKENI